MIPLGNLISFQDYNGTVLAAGKLYVFNLGRNGLATVYGDVNGAVVLPNPVTLDNLGMSDIWLSPVFDYTLVVTDAYGAEMFSRDIYPQRPGSGETIGTQLYNGIDPIVVNNQTYTISANTSRLGVIEPLYFVRDDEEETIIGMSAIAVPSGTMNESAFSYQDDKITAYNGSAFSAGNEYEAGNYVSIDNNIISVTGLQPSGDYQSAGNYVSASELENLQPKGDYYSASNPSGFLIDEDITGKLDTTAFSTVSGDFLTAVPSEYITENTLQSGLSSKLDSTAFSTVSGNFLTAHQSLDGYATEQWVEEKGYITGIDIPQSANWNNATTVVNNNSAIWNNTTNVVSSNSAQWGATNPQIPVTGINGIKISESGDKVVFEVSGDYATHDDLTSKQDSLTYGYHDTAISSIDNSALYDSSAHARINTLAGRISDLSSNKLDESAFSDVSGSFLTALPSDLVYTADIADMATTGDINDLVTSIAETYQSTAGMTAYQSAGEYYSASNPSGFITEVPAGTMNESAFGYDSDNKISSYNGSAFAGGSYQPSGNYIPYTAVDSTFNTFKTNSGLEITTSIGNTNFINSNYINLRYINSNLNINNQSILSNDSLRFQTKSDSAYVDREKIHKWDSASDYIQNNSATINEVNTSYQTNSGTYLTAHQDLSDYQTTAGMTAYLTAVPDTYLQNSDLTITNNKVTEISGIPLSAGTELEFEYDEADHISAINNSAISTTPSRDLYIKAPLYTGMTGTSAYIGVYESAIQPLVFGYTAIGE